jgi:hypothetical protein
VSGFAEAKAPLKNTSSAGMNRNLGIAIVCDQGGMFLVMLMNAVIGSFTPE